MKRLGRLVALAAIGLLMGFGQVPAQAGWFGLGDSSKPAAAKEKKLPAKDKKAPSSKSKAGAQSTAKKASGGSAGWFGGLFASKKPAPKKVATPASSASTHVPKQNKESSSPLASLFGKKPSPR